MKQEQTALWRDYEAGKEYKLRLGIYETLRRNERFYRGDQWYGTDAKLPRPVFNLVRRITDYLVASVLPGDLTITYTDDRLPFLDNSASRELVNRGIRTLNRNAAYRWRRSQMKALSHRALLNAALSGDAVFYCWWDDSHFEGQPYRGEIRTDLIENTSLFVSDVASTDLQSQRYVMLAGRAEVSELQREAREFGCSEAEIASIIPDTDPSVRASDCDGCDLRGSEKATYLIKFYREGGEVICEKATQYCTVSRVNTGLRYYPVAYFNWNPTKGSFHGASPVSDLIANQKYINTAYAMVMKHMYDTAFSKVVYDKSRIPEWSNEVGEAIAAMGGGNVADAVSVVGTGELQEGYLELIENVVETTKNMMGATESALGDAQANNTSAILVLQQASQLALRRVGSDFCRCIGEIATIWADMLCTYCPPERLLIVEENGELLAEAPDYQLLRGELLRAGAEITQVDAYTPSATVAVLDRLLAADRITIEQYVRLLPDGVLGNRELFLQTIGEKGDVRNE